jgi:WD40 repeat protein/transcriptional regulator with XRE-family HTH domain
VASSTDSIQADRFRGLLLRFRGRTGLSQTVLAQRTGVSLRSVQNWETGVSLPGSERLRDLLQALLEAGGLAREAELTEAEELWDAAQLASSRSIPPFDSRWFAELLAKGAQPLSVGPSASPTAQAGTRIQDWGDAPDTFGFVGRSAELQLLSGWVTRDRARLLVLRGMGGIGKTSLAARLAREAAPAFKSTYWRSVRNAPTFAEWSAGAIAFVSGHQRTPPESPAARLDALLDLLQAAPSLLVLDNLEVLLEPGRGEGQFRAGYEAYGSLIRVLGQSAHQSCLLVTTREVPQEIAMEDSAAAGVHVMELGGIDEGNARALLQDKRLDGDDAAWSALVTHYAGNPLALRIVGETIQQVFGGDIERFVEQSESIGAFGGIRRLLEAQFERLSTIERELLQVLAIEREPTNFLTLAAQIAPRATRAAALEGVEALRHRSLLERTEAPATFGLHSVVLEYVTDRLVASGAAEIERGEFELLANRALIRAQASEHVRQSQERLIGQPMLDQLASLVGGRAERVEQRLIEVLGKERARPLEQHGFAPGNLVNLLRLVRGNLRGIDLSHLSIRQAYLQDIEAQDANLAEARLTETVLGDSFGAVGAVAISADGERIGAGTLGGAVRVWRMADRAPLLSGRPTLGGIWSVALSSDGRLFASGSLDATVELWDVDSGTRLPFDLRQASPVTRVALTRDTRRLVTAALDGILRVWDVETGQLMYTAEGHRGAVYGLAVSIDGDSMGTGGLDGSVRLWDLRTGRAHLELSGHDGTVWSVSVDESASLVASGGQDGTARVWDASTGVLVRTLEGHVGPVRAVALTADGELLATGGFDGTLRLWEPRSGRRLASVLSHSGGVRGVAIRRDGGTIVSGGFDASVRVWDARGARPLATMRGHTGGVRALAVSGQGRIASGGPDAHVQLWDAESGQLQMTLEHASASVRAVALDYHAALLASGGLDSTVRMWNVQTGRSVRSLEGHTAAVLALAMTPRGDILASGGLDGTVRLWSTDTGGLLAVLEGHGGAVWCVALSLDGGIAACGGLDGSVRLWNTRSHQLLASLQGHVGGVRSVSLSADAQTVASAGDDGSVRIWDAPRGVCSAVLEGHSAAVYGVSISPDNQTVASGSVDRTVRLWSRSTGQLLAVLDGHTDAVYTIAFSGDSEWLASGGLDATVRLWNTRNHQPRRTLHPDRRYERMDITQLTGMTEAQRDTLISLGAISR